MGSCNEQCAPDHHWEMKLFGILLLLVVIGITKHTEGASLKEATSFMEENPVPSIDHYRDLNNGHLGLQSHRVRRSFGSTNPIILKLSSLVGPCAPLVLKAAKIFCKITGPGIFC